MTLKINLNKKQKKMTKIKDNLEPEKKSTKIQKDFVFAVGRRKTAVARIRLFRGKGQTLVNDQPIEKYFSGEVAKSFYQKPFVVSETLGKYYATIKVEGSGKNSQMEAVIHGLARALNKENKENYHDILKKAHLLTRDSRARERRKIGQMGRARKKKQSPKR
jgi:small subunit ribosomal protein S9